MSQVRPGRGSGGVKQTAHFEKSDVLQAAGLLLLSVQSPGPRHLGCMVLPSQWNQLCGGGSWEASSEQQWLMNQMMCRYDCPLHGSVNAMAYEPASLG